MCLFSLLFTPFCNFESMVAIVQASCFRSSAASRRAMNASSSTEDVMKTSQHNGSASTTYDVTCAPTGILYEDYKDLLGKGIFTYLSNHSFIYVCIKDI